MGSQPLDINNNILHQLLQANILGNSLELKCSILELQCIMKC